LREACGGEMNPGELIRTHEGIVFQEQEETLRARMSGLELWCSTCKTRHLPTEAHPVCRDGIQSPHLHQPFPVDISMEHRGWRFFYPFYCFTCGARVCPHQFAFSRSCGPCNLSESRSRILSPMERRIFAGRHVRCGSGGRADLNNLDVIDVNSDLARELIRNGPSSQALQYRRLGETLRRGRQK
jgi:hypothetical protein